MNPVNEHVPRVAIITRTRNRPVLLRRAIESVLAQTFPDWVHVIINDGGQPAGVDLLAAEFGAAYGGRVRVIHNPQSAGMQNASNLAIRASASEYVTIHDDDDSWEPAFLERCVAHLEALGAASPVQGVSTHSTWVIEEINANGQVVELSRTDYFPRETISLLEMAGENLFPPIAFLYRRAAHDRVGYFNETFSVLGDWDFNLRFLSAFEIDLIPEKLARYHWRQQGVYGNTVTTGLHIHKEKQTRLFNHYLRQDLETGRPGLGHLMNVSARIRELSQSVDKLRVSADLQAARVGATLGHVEHLTRITRDLARLWEVKHSIARGIRTVAARRRAAAGRASAAPGGRDARAEVARFLAELPPDGVLTLDVFDTALLRTVRQPANVFAFIEPDVQALLGQPGLPFAQARSAAERIARQRHAADGREDVTLDQVYAVLAESLGIGPDAAARIRELELGAEKRLAFANPAILDACRAARARGARVAFVSDMYLPSEFIRDLLAGQGYEAPEVFVSSAEGRTKHSGALFGLVLERLGCPAGRVFHIGDDRRADYDRPRALGIRALHVDRQRWTGLPLADQHVALTGTGESDVLSSVFTGLARRRAAAQTGRDLWEQLGYEVAGPLMYAFVRWIGQQARRNGTRKLFFLSRDGYYLQRTFQKCAAQWGLDVDSSYMYSSRRLLNLARIEALDERSLGFLLSPNPNLRPRDVINRIGLDADRHLPAVRKAGLAMDEVLTTCGGGFVSGEVRERVRSVLVELGPLILSIAAEERKNVLAYFRSVGFAAGPMAIVDVGWQASSIQSLQDLLNLGGGDFRLRGYYFGTWTYARPALEAGGLIESFFFHLDKPEHRSRLVAECTEMVEYLFSAPHPTVVSLKPAGDRWEPVFGAWETAPAQRACLDRTFAAAQAFVDDMVALGPLPGASATPFGYLESVLERILRHPVREEAEVLGQLPHRESFGGVTPCRHLARVPGILKSVFDPASLQEAYNHAYWKKGFLAQLSPEEQGRLTR